MTQQEDFRLLIENASAQERFSLPRILQDAQAVLSGTRPMEYHTVVAERLGSRVGRYILGGVLRAFFLIELVKTPKIETTKFEVRWGSRIDASDPRFLSYDACFEIFGSVMSQLNDALDYQGNCDLLKLFESQNMLPWEIPLDYRERRIHSKIHELDNLVWIWDDIPKRVMKLRSFLLKEDTNPYAPFFSAAYDKIKVKTYLTDRVLTGDHKTNREKRWETHPASVHFALRRTCMDIEYVLVNQLCHFEGLPADLKNMLNASNLLSPMQEPFRCPITMDILSFTEFEREVRDPQHGKASFQVGHLNPLKAVSEDPNSGHTAQNISWISSDGNRIQGNLPLYEVRTLIQRIYENFTQFGGTT